MASYLLSTKALYEFVVGRDRSAATVFHDWTQSLSGSQHLFVSEISLGELRTSVEREENLQRRDTWRTNLQIRIPRYFGARVLPFTGLAVERWGLIRLVGRPPLPTEETQLIAQALEGNLSLVGPRTPIHAEIGCKMHDPYDGAGWPGPAL